MPVIYETACAEDLDRGYGAVVKTNPAGGVLAGNKIGIHTFLPGLFNPKDTGFGALGDNANDDTVELQTALTAAAGKTLIIPPGIYLISAALIVPTGTTVIGYNATIKQRAGAESFAALSLITVSGVTIRDLILDGNKANVTGGSYGILVDDTTDCRIEGCTVKNWTEVGIFGVTSNTRLSLVDNTVTGNGKAGAVNGLGIFIRDNVTGLKVQGNKISGSLTHGLLVSRVAGAASHVAVSVNEVLDNTQVGIYLSGVTGASVTGNVSKGNRDGILVDGASSGITIAGNTAYNSAGDAAGDGIVVEGSSNCTITGNNAYSNRAKGIYLQTCTHCAVSGNTAKSNNVDGIAGTGGIHLYACTDCEVSGNLSYDVPVATQIYGITEEDACDRNIFSGNKCLGNVTGAINLVGTSSVASGIVRKTTAGDPAAADTYEGLTCINTNDNNVKIYADAAWRQIAGGW